jgi:hypothetical protein
MIFPEVEGKVSRVDTPLVMIERVYREGLLPLRPSGIRVTRALADRIRQLSEQAFYRGLPQRIIDGLRRQGFASAILGIRIQNRTIIDFDAFCVSLIEMLHAELGRVAVVIDGMNSSENGFRYRVTHQDAAPVPLQDVEERFAADLMEKFQGHDEIIILSSVGLPVGASIAIGDVADFFVTPWGAGLAKYRWVNNLSGLALAGPTCAKMQPIHLYDDPVFMENPSPIYFMDRADVEDAPEGPRLIASGLDDRINIRVNMDALRKRIRQMLGDLGLSGREPVDVSA